MYIIYKHFITATLPINALNSSPPFEFYWYYSKTYLLPWYLVVHNNLSHLENGLHNYYCHIGDFQNSDCHLDSFLGQYHIFAGQSNRYRCVCGFHCMNILCNSLCLQQSVLYRSHKWGCQNTRYHLHMDPRNTHISLGRQSHCNLNQCYR